MAMRRRVQMVGVLLGALWVGLVGLLGLRRSYPCGCIMTYMYPTYIPLAPPANASATKYGLYHYHEGWKKIDYELQLLKLSGVPVLFVPGNGGSYKQVRSLAAESDRAFNGGPLEESFYRVASVTKEEIGESLDASDVNQADSVQAVQDIMADLKAEGQYPNHLDWFSVDLDGEHSAMDGRILEEHTEYVVLAIHRILDRYKESIETRSKERSGFEETLPTSVVLVGHSMGGFVARAAIVHPGLRKGAVQTLLTLSSPHLFPPVAMQPSLGHFFSRVNNVWRRGFDSSPFRPRRWRSTSPLSLSNVVVVSLVGGPRDYQVRSKMASLDGIVPPTNGLTVGAPGMFNVWLAMEHQSILWCNQLVVQVSHALLQIIDIKSGQPFVDPQRRISTFAANLRTALPQSLGWMSGQPQKSIMEKLPLETGGGEGFSNPFSCPGSVRWSDESHEKDLYIETPTVTILAMDGRRRWLDIKKMSSDGKDHFVLVTNLQPCLGVRVHLWPEKHVAKDLEKSVNQRIVEVTTMMVQLPAGPTPRQVEPGGQTEQAPPSGFLRLTPKELHGFRFITISVAPRPTISGRPPPAASMAVGQFFKPASGAVALSPMWLLSSSYMKKELYLQENHPLVLNYSVSVSMGVLPLTMELITTSCGIRDSVLANQQSGDNEHTSLCKLRCFPPVVSVWDPLSGLSIIPNFYSETIELDSSPALWAARSSSKEATILIMVDPHCAYKVSMAVSLSAAATRFLLFHGMQITGFAITILLYALMQQARAWEFDQPLPSVLACLERNLTSWPILISLNAAPLALYTLLGLLRAETSSSFITFVLVSFTCYFFANAIVILLALIAQVIFHAAASTHTFISARWKTWEGRLLSLSFFRFLSVFGLIYRLQFIRVIRGWPAVTCAILAMMLVVFAHPALGLMALLLAHIWGCYVALYSHRSQKGALRISKQECDLKTEASIVEGNHSVNVETVIGFGDTQFENFNYRQGLLLLHLIATTMLIPSLVAWGQRLGMDLSYPWLLDASLCFGIILHGLFASKADVNMPFVPLPHLFRWTSIDCGMSFVYLTAGIFCYLCALDLAPYRCFYALAAIGVLATIIRVLQRRIGTKDDFLNRRRHFHRH